MGSSATGGRREEKQRQTRAAIIQAASELFASCGYEETPTRAIAEAAGVAHGTLFRYAPTKEAIVQLIFEDSIGVAFRSARSALPQGSFTDVAMHMYEAFFATYGQDPALARVLVKEVAFMRGETRAASMVLTLELFALLSADVQARQERGLLRADIVSFAFVTHSFGLYFMALMSWLTDEVDIDVALLLCRQGIELLERGATP